MKHILFLLLVLAIPSLAQFGISARSVQRGQYTYCASVVGTDSYACALVPTLAAYTVGQALHLKADVANTGAASVDFGPGPKTIKKRAGGITTDLATGDIPAGALVTVSYDGTNFQCDAGCDGVAVSGGGITDPGGNGFLDRTALNTVVNRTLTGTTNQVSITNGSGGGNPVFSTPQDIHTAATPQFARIGAGAAADANAGFQTTQAIGATSTDGIVAQNTTTATSGNQKWSPRIRWSGKGWSGSASQDVTFYAEVVPVQSSSGRFALWESIAGAAANNLAYFCYACNGNTPWLSLTQSTTPTAYAVPSGGGPSFEGTAFLGVNNSTAQLQEIVVSRNTSTSAAAGARYLIKLRDNFGASTVRDAAYIDFGKQQNWAATGSTDSYIGFQTLIDAVMAERFRLVNGHALTLGTAPTITANFGTSPTIDGKDDAGRVTVGTGGTDATGTVTFAQPYGIAPACVCNNETTTLLCKATATTTTLVMASATAFTAGDKLTWNCAGWQ